MLIRERIGVLCVSVGNGSDVLLGENHSKEWQQHFLATALAECTFEGIIEQQVDELGVSVIFREPVTTFR